MARRKPKKRRRKLRTASPAPPTHTQSRSDAPITISAEESVEKAERIVARAERFAAQVEKDATRLSNVTRSVDRRAGAFRAAERAIEAMENPPPPGFFKRLANRAKRWRHARRRAGLIKRLDRSLARRDACTADHSSAALLAVLTERIALFDAVGSVEDVSAALEIAGRVRDDYEAYVARLVEMRDSARAEAAFWRTKVTKAQDAEATDLAEQAQQRVSDWDRRDREAAAVLVRCEAGRERLADALAQLKALAARSAKVT